MKDKFLLQYKRLKRFLIRKRKFPIVINLNFRSSPNVWELKSQIMNLHYSNKLLKREIKRLKTIIELRDMDISLNKGDYQ